MSETIGTLSRECSKSSLNDILKNCVNLQSYESLPIEEEDFNDDVCQKIIASQLYTLSGAMSNSSCYASEDSYTSDNILEDNGRISLAYENLHTIPRRIADKFSGNTKFLDLSHNNFSNLSFLSFFEELHTLILDRNINLDVNTLPYLPNLRILWINNCNISNITDWIHRIERQCPTLDHLSLMGNPGIKTLFTYYTLPLYTQHSDPGVSPMATCDYREYIQHVLPNLRYLDGISICTLTNSSTSTGSYTTRITSSSCTSMGNDSTNSVPDDRLNGRQRISSTLNFKELLRFPKRRKSYNSSSTN